MQNTPLPLATQTAILNSILAMVPSGVKNAGDRRHQLLCGAVFALQAIDHEIVPPHWTMCLMSHTTNRLFTGLEPTKPVAVPIITWTTQPNQNQPTNQ